MCGRMTWWTWHGAQTHPSFSSSSSMATALPPRRWARPLKLLDRRHLWATLLWHSVEAACCSLGADRLLRVAPLSSMIPPQQAVPRTSCGCSQKVQQCHDRMASCRLGVSPDCTAAVLPPQHTHTHTVAPDAGQPNVGQSTVMKLSHLSTGPSPRSDHAATR